MGLTLCDPMDCIACQAPLSLGFSMQEYWSGLPCPFLGNLPKQDQTGISYVSCRQTGSLPLAPLGKLILSWYTGPKVTKSPLEIRKQA